MFQPTCVDLMMLKEVTTSEDGRKLIERTEVEVRNRKLKNGKTADMGEAPGKVEKGQGDREVDWIWRLYSMAFEWCSA